MCFSCLKNVACSLHFRDLELRLRLDDLPCIPDSKNGVPTMRELNRTEMTD